VLAGIIPVLVFDCVALRYKMGISSRFSRVNPLARGLFTLGNVWTLLGFSGHPLFPKERCFERVLEVDNFKKKFQLNKKRRKVK